MNALITIEDTEGLDALPSGTVLASAPNSEHGGMTGFFRKTDHTNGLGGTLFDTWEQWPQQNENDNGFEASYQIVPDTELDLPMVVLNPEVFGGWKPAPAPEPANAEGTTVYITGNNTDEWDHSFEVGTEVEVVIDDTVLDGSLYVREADGNEDSVHNWVSVADVDVEQPVEAFQPGDVIRRKDDALPRFTFVVQADRLLSSCNGSPFRQATGWGLKQANTAFFEKVA